MKESNDSPSKIISLNYNQKKYQFNTELIKPINTFYNEVCSYLQINPNDYNLYYNNKKMTINNYINPTLSFIISSDKDSIFQIMQKKTKIPYKLKLSYSEVKNVNKTNILSSKKKIPSNLKSLSITKKKSHINNLKSISQINNIPKSLGVIISQVPSIKDIETILQDFNSKQNNSSVNNTNNFNGKKGVLTILENNSVKVVFQDEITLNRFISYISFMKYENPYYKNIIIKKENSNNKRKKIGKNLSSSQKNMRVFFSDFNKKYNYNEQNKKINVNDVIKALKEHALNNECYHGLSLNRTGENEIITDYYKQQKFLRNSSPYISEDEKRILEEKENKKHYIDKNKNFVSCVWKYSIKPNYIPNYVGVTPSENPNEHSFRKVDKKKWITIKGFNV